MSRIHVFLVLLFAGVVGTLDAILKQTALTRFPLEGDRVSFPVDFILHRNPGIAFDIPLPLPLIFVGTAGICTWIGFHMVHAWKNQAYQIFSSGLLILVGAMGNFVDRLIHGFTTDYLLLFQISAINLSDILIVLGMIGFLWYSSFHPQNSRA